MRRLLAAFCLLLAALAAAPMALAQGPLAPAPGFRPPPATEAQAEPNVFDRFVAWAQRQSQELSRDIAAALRDLKAESPLAAGFALALFSFVYGVLHAVGPGHGKAIISGYVLANERTLRRGVTLAVLSSLVQALTAIAMVVGVVIVARALGFNMTSQDLQQAGGWMERVSFALVILAGAWLLFTALKRYVLAPRARAAIGEGSGHAHHAHGHGENCGCGHPHAPDPAKLGDGYSWRQAATIVLAVGLRPCSGAILVLIFALTQGMFWAGVFSTFAMAAGTAITVSALAVAAVASRDFAVRAGGRAGGAWARGIEATAAIGGALFVLLIGAALLAGSFGPPRPFTY